MQLIDAASEHLSDAEIVRRVAAFETDVVMIAHVGSTSAHPCCLRVLRAVKAALPGRPAGHVSRMCETAGRPVIGSACYGFECVNNLSYGIVVTTSRGTLNSTTASKRS